MDAENYSCQLIDRILFDELVKSHKLINCLKTYSTFFQNNIEDL